jgi:antitoxin HicB
VTESRLLVQRIVSPRPTAIFDEVTAQAAKQVIAYRVSGQMAQQKVSKSEMARRMKTSRSALDRLLDPENSSVTLLTLQRAAEALDGRLSVELIFRKPSVLINTSSDAMARSCLI